MLTSKQRARLRALSNGIDTIVHVGKGDISQNLIKQVGDALEARELIKGRVLDNSLYSAREAGEELAEATHSDLVCTIGSRFILYRKNHKDPKIVID